MLDTSQLGQSEAANPTEVSARGFELSEQQEHAKSMILAWLDDPEEQEFRLGGYAGTGKTTLISDIIETNRSFVSIGVGAFTGKAVSVLRRKGIWRAVTLHSMLYVADYSPILKKIIWTPRTVLPYDVVIVDEASMVSQQLYDDLKRHGVKLLFVGDPAQLEPVGGDNPNLMRRCDFTLTEIHRQAQLNPILRFANAIRSGASRNSFPAGSWDRGDNGKLTIARSVYGLDLADFDVILCAKNATRHAFNAKRRAQLDRFAEPVVGEQVICLMNDKEKGVFNGMILKIDMFHPTSWGREDYVYVNMSDDVDEYNEIPMSLEYFGKDFKRESGARRRTSIPFDYAYALTCHKSQGSEFDRVLVFDEPLYGTEWNRWAYTAATRAAKELTYVL
jgi:exodeoxyribonuclease-5